MIQHLMSVASIVKSVGFAKLRGFSVDYRIRLSNVARFSAYKITNSSKLLVREQRVLLERLLCKIQMLL